MSTEVEQTSVIEPDRTKMSGAATSSSTSTSTPKVSLFGAKSGFVIPKNKLSGSLVPIFQRNKKLTGSDGAKEESPKQVQRKTMWGPDLTQDASVRRGRALALQTRVDQITQLLRSGFLAFDESLDAPLSSEQKERKSSSHVLDREKSKQLEIEMREAIGEILKLNASYKAPPDYKPLLKEERVPIPIKEFPGYNFVGLIFGPGGDNRKRLEKETGAKIQVYGIKAGKDKGEMIPADGNDIQGSYEEIYVHVSADTFDKVDAAVSVIELLVTSISGNLSAAADNKRVHDEQQPTSAPMDAAPMAPQGAAEPFMGTSQPPPSQGQFQFSGPWASNPSMPSPSPNPTHPNSSIPVNNIPLHQPSMPSNPPNMPFTFSSQHSVAGPNLPPPNQSPFMQNPYMNHPPRPSDIRVPPPITQPSSSQFPSVARPLVNQGPPPPIFPQPNIGPPISNPSMANTNPSPPSNFASGPPPPTSMGGPLNRPNPSPFPSSMPLPMNNPQGMPPIPRGNPLNSSLGPGPSELPPRLPFPPHFDSGPGPSFLRMRTSSAAPPHNSNFNDFTFRPHQQQQPQGPRFLPPNAAPPPQAPPSFRPSPHPDFQPRPDLYPRPPPVQGRFPFPNQGPLMGDMNFGPSARPPNLGRPAFPSGQGNMMEPRTMFRPSMNRGDMFLPPNQQFGRNVPFGSHGPGTREPQVYDPFSPTSVPNMPHRQGDNTSSGRRRDNDPEYEDLMASVGVK